MEKQKKKRKGEEIIYLENTKHIDFIMSIMRRIAHRPTDRLADRQTIAKTIYFYGRYYYRLPFVIVVVCGCFQLIFNANYGELKLNHLVGWRGLN